MMNPMKSVPPNPEDIAEPTTQASRRTVLKAGAVGAASIAASRFAFTQSYAGASSPVLAPQLEGGVDPFITPPAYALVDRITFGKTTYETGLFDAKGWDGYLNYHLAPAAIPDDAVNGWLTEFPSIFTTPYTALKVYGYDQGFDVFGDLCQSQMIRQIYSRRQLQELMTEFWLDHFNVFVGAIWSEFLPQYVRMIRANALGNFATLLTGVVRAGAMLMYLNNVQNDNTNHNENFARELLELHTLGAYQGYTEADIYTVRRCLTGWNFRGYYNWPWKNTTDSNWGQFQFYPEHHDNEGGVFLGVTFLKGDMEQGTKIISMLANHPNTAKRIATKLITKFVTETPSAAFVTAAANVFTANKGNIAAVLRYILSQSVFTANYKPKFKRPARYTHSVLRASYATMSDANDLIYNALQPMRQMPFQWQPPNGYPDVQLPWVDNLLPRWRFASNFVFNWMWGMKFDPFPYITDRTREGVLNYINSYYFAKGLSTTRLAQLRTYLGATNPTNAKIREAIGLAVSLPDFQWY